jgi:hypothetical protein
MYTNINDNFRSLEGILDELRSDRLVDGVAIDNIFTNDSDEDEAVYSGVYICIRYIRCITVSYPTFSIP